MHVVIVGAGPAGCAAALELRRRDIAVTLISDGADAVGELLPPSARPFLDHLHLQPLENQLECVGVRSAWHSDELSDQDFIYHPLGHGWLLDRGRFGRQLRQHAVAAGARLRQPERLERIARHGAWRLGLSSGELRCDWVLDASGRRSIIARMLGVRRRRFDGQAACVRWLKTHDDGDGDSTLTVERTGDGWWYTCRVADRRRVAVWLSPRPFVRAWDEQVCRTRHVRARLAAYQPNGSAVVRPADSSLLEQTAGAGWLAIGDAAVSYDPLASRGIVSALASGIEAATLVGAGDDQLAARHARLEAAFHHYLRQRQQFYGAMRPGAESGAWDV